MRIIIVLILLLAYTTSCSSYQKALKSEDNALKVKVADSLFQKKKYNKSIRLFEQAISSYRGKPSGERYFFMYSDCLFNTKDYVNAAYQYERFHSSYPKSSKAEEALYKSTLSYSYLSPTFSKDQVDTYKAIEKLQIFLDEYPDSEYTERANIIAIDMQEKIEKKFFEIAKQYYTIYDYRAALKALDNFIIDFPGTKYREDAMFYKLLSQYEYAQKSVSNKIKERLFEAKQLHEKFKENYPQSKYQAKVDKLAESINNNLQKL